MKSWLFTAVSFAAVIGVSVYAVKSSAPDGVNLAIPPLAHALALLAFAVDVSGRSLKMTFSARAVGTRLEFFTAMRAGLGGDFAASITPAHLGAEPTRYLILAESGTKGPALVVILYTELFFEMISLIAIASLMLLFFDASRASVLSMGGILSAYSATILGIGATGIVLARRNVGGEPPSWARRLRLTGKRWGLAQRALDGAHVTVAAFKRMHRGWGTASCAASIVHVAARFSILPVLVRVTANADVPIGPLVVWPFTLFYGGNVVPAPGGGGAVELAFQAALGGTIPAETFAGALVWWRFYTFYLLVALGAVFAGGTALRAIRARPAN